jgi:hypothetical protein
VKLGAPPRLDVAVGRAVGVEVGANVAVVAGAAVAAKRDPALAFQEYNVPQPGEKIPIRMLYAPFAALVGTDQVI